MRSGCARRCASYCTWSSRSSTTVLESADDQCRIPVTRGIFNNSCGVTLLLSSALASESAPASAFDAEFDCPSPLPLAGFTKDGFAEDEEESTIPTPGSCAVAPGLETFDSGRF